MDTDAAGGMVDSIEHKIEKEIKTLESDLAESGVKLSTLRQGYEKAKQAYLKQKAKHEQLQGKVQTLQGKLKNIEAKSYTKQDFPWSNKLHHILQNQFNITELRPLQLETMNCFLANQNCYLVMPTGGGKSLCFQAPALVDKGLSLVITPTLSLIQDQVTLLCDTHGIHAASLTSDTTADQAKAILAEIINPNSTLKLLYVTPERAVKSKRLKAKLEESRKKGLLKHLVIDEVHCASEWGHDFRTDYRELYYLTHDPINLPVLGLTATATTSVLDDVTKQLLLEKSDMVTFRGHFNRPNLYYKVINKPSNFKECIKLISDMINTKYKGETGIVYCMTRNDAVKVSQALTECNISTMFYHGDVQAADRKRYHSMWMSGHIQVMVATVAFGLGISKDNVRFIIHHSLTKTMENYYQESGRAGRDGERAEVTVLYRLADVFRLSVMIGRHPQTVRKLYNMVRWCINRRTCRRRHMAEILEEENVNDVECNQMCDNCRHTEQVVDLDISELWEAVVKILTMDHHTTCQQLVTGITKDSKDICRKLSLCVPIGVERCVAHLLVSGLLYEEDHFTPYNTISYLRVHEGRQDQLKLVPVPVCELTSAGEGPSGSSSSGKRRRIDTSTPQTGTGQDIDSD